GRLRCAGAAETGASSQPLTAATNAPRTTPFKNLCFMTFLPRARISSILMPAFGHQHASFRGERQRGLGFSRRGRNREAVELDIPAPQEVPAGKIQGFQIGSPEGDVGGGRPAMDDSAKLLALRVHDVDAARTAAINIAG